MTDLSIDFTSDLAKGEYVNDQKEDGITIDPDYGPIHYTPYDGGVAFPNFETITEKPAIGGWMDGGVVAYQDKLCYVKMLDCSQTCCMNSYCAPHMGFCLNYVRQDFNQLYIGVLVAVTIVVGIPSCVSFCDCILNYKFGQVYNEEADATLGGLTCCEAFSYCCTCGKCMNTPETMQDNWVV